MLLTQSLLSMSTGPSWFPIDRPDDSATDPTEDDEPSRSFGGAERRGRGVIWSRGLLNPTMVSYPLTLARGRSRPTLFEAESGRIASGRGRDVRTHPGRWLPALSRIGAVRRPPPPPPIRTSVDGVSPTSAGGPCTDE